jgi:hypothetical protein
MHRRKFLKRVVMEAAALVGASTVYQARESIIPVSVLSAQTGRYYEDEVPDTLDLAERARLGLNYFTEIIQEDRNYLERLSLTQIALLDSYRRSGGKIYSLGDLGTEKAPVDIQSSVLTLTALETSEQSKTEVLNNLSQLINNRKIRLENSGQVLAVVTKIRNGERAVLHLINHDERPQTQLRITLDLAFLSFRPEEGLVRAY